MSKQRNPFDDIVGLDFAAALDEANAWSRMRLTTRKAAALVKDRVEIPARRPRALRHVWQRDVGAQPEPREAAGFLLRVHRLPPARPARLHE